MLEGRTAAGRGEVEGRTATPESEATRSEWRVALSLSRVRLAKHMLIDPSNVQWRLTAGGAAIEVRKAAAISRPRLVATGRLRAR